MVRAGGFDRFTATNVTTTVNNKGQTIPDTNATVDIGRLTFSTETLMTPRKSVRRS